MDEKKIEEIGRDAAYKSCMFPLIKMLGSLSNEEKNRLESNKIEAAKIIVKLCEKANLTLEIHPYSLETHIDTIAWAIESEKYLSAAVLTAISLEEDVNGFFRMACLAKGYSHNEITKYMSEIGLKTKLNLVIPLTGVVVPEQYKTMVFELFPLRNKAVHGKCVPSFSTVEKEVDNSIKENETHAKMLMERFSISKIKEYSNAFECSVMDIPEIKLASNILRTVLWEQ